MTDRPQAPPAVVQVSSALRVSDADTLLSISRRASKLLADRHNTSLDLKAMCLRVGHAEVTYASPLCAVPVGMCDALALEASRKTREYRCDSGRELRSHSFLQRWIGEQEGGLFHITMSLAAATSELRAKASVRCARAATRSRANSARSISGGARGRAFASFRESPIIPRTAQERFRSPLARIPSERMSSRHL
eukprot:TRINITY_DN68422_c0_g1_i1.p1 TRINITY_DN68422_c0_g1~~TRINITY_DN68422_c0_g1_i1.p1  ORF type:complete len:225 (+),score=58.24 TRINITY_DN68422_c0_g1_i1:97-675(+)